MTTLTVISKYTYEAEHNTKLGSLLYPSYWYDCKHHVDTTKLRKIIKDRIPKGVRILHVLIPTENNINHYRNVINKQVPYKTAVCASQSQDGAYYKTYPEMNFSMWASDYPVGDAVIVINA